MTPSRAVGCISCVILAMSSPAEFRMERQKAGALSGAPDKADRNLSGAHNHLKMQKRKPAIDFYDRLDNPNAAGASR